MILPPDQMPDVNDAAELLEAYVTAEGWVEGSSSTKEMKAWDKRRNLLRAQILKLMNAGLGS